MKTVCTFQQALKDLEGLDRIDTVQQKDGLPIDGKIRNLVAALRMFGIKTFQSCQGHRDRWHRAATHPFVQTIPTDLVPLTELVVYHNRIVTRRQLCHWVIVPHHFALTLQPEDCRLPLRELHYQAERFALNLKRLGAKS